MKILVLLMTCEKDLAIARATLAQLVELFRHHELHILLFDDGSPSQGGHLLEREFEARIKGTFSVLKNERPKGYLRLVENFMAMLAKAVSDGIDYDYVLRTDPDVHFCDRTLLDLFDDGRLPKRGVIAPHFPMRRRDFLLVLADLVPFGFQRRRRGETYDRKWQFAGFRRVWWSGFGWAALHRGYRGEVTPGSFVLMAWETVQAIARTGAFERDHAQTGLVFADDLMVAILAKAVGHPIHHVKDLVPSWSCEMFLPEGMEVELLRNERHAFVHPVKDSPWGSALRHALKPD
jgi:hypothetical protein